MSSDGLHDNIGINDLSLGAVWASVPLAHGAMGLLHCWT